MLIRIPEDIWEKLTIIKNRFRKPVAVTIREALYEYLEKGREK